MQYVASSSVWTAVAGDQGLGTLYTAHVSSPGSRGRDAKVKALSSSFADEGFLLIHDSPFFLYPLSGEEEAAPLRTLLRALALFLRAPPA